MDKCRLSERRPMGDRKITLLELHLDGPLSIGPSFGDDPGPAVSTDASTDASTDKASPRSSDDGDASTSSVSERGDSLPVKGAIVGFLALLALAIAARVLLGDAESDSDPEMVDLEQRADAED
jgi:hypothetical protein